MENKRFVIRDSQGNYADEGSIFLLQDSNQLEWRYFVCKSCVNTFIYPTKDKAEKVAYYLNHLNQMPKFDLTFRVEEYVLGDDTNRDDVQMSRVVPKGSKGKVRNYFRASHKVFLSDNQECKCKNTVTAYAAGIPIEFETDLTQAELNALCDV